jgi:hypothetical protein
MALGSALAARSTAAKSPLAGLDRTFRALQPAARCAAGADKAATARRLRAAALKNAAEAPPKVLKRKKASMRRAIRLLRTAGDLCEAPAPPAPGPAPGPPGPGLQTISLTGTNFAFSPSTPAPTAKAGVPIRLALTNGTTDTGHRIGARIPGQPAIAESPIAAPGLSSSVDVTLPAGSYQIFCGIGDHAALGMTLPLTVNP